VDLNQLFRFDTFLVGASNRLAATAARTVAQTPGTAYNPLFIYSATGLGKTHLLMAIGQQAKQVAPTVVVEYLTLEEFVEAFHAAVAAGQSDAFRNRFGNVDILLIDDVQFLTHRREMQAELLRLIGQLQAADKQIVLSSDCPPAEIEGLDERLVSGFAGGLIVDMGRPDFETRLAILRRRSEERGAEFGPGVLEAVAAFEAANVRELVGTLNRLAAFQAVNEAPLTPESAAALLGWEGGEAPAVPAPPPPKPADEFSDFLSDVTSVLARQVEAWRRRVAEAIMRWEGEGYRTARLEALLNQSAPVSSEAALRQFERDVERLRELEAEMTGMDPTGGGHAAFRDPDRVADAEALVQRAREGLSPPPGPSPLWTFEGYAGGEANKVALTAARAASEQPGRRYNPLVLVGPAGVGKTHLLHAIGNVLVKARKFKEYQAANGEEIRALEPIDRVPRMLQAAELTDGLPFQPDEVELIEGVKEIEQV